MNEGGDATLFCYSACPKGTLPYLPSFYYLNPTLFPQEELEKQQTDTTSASIASSSNTE